MKKWIAQIFSDVVIWGLLAIAYFCPAIGGWAENGLMFWAWISFFLATLMLIGADHIAYSPEFTEKSKALIMDDSKLRSGWAMFSTWVEAFLMAGLGMIVTSLFYLLSVYLFRIARDKIRDHIIAQRLKEKGNAGAEPEGTA